MYSFGTTSCTFSDSISRSWFFEIPCCNVSKYLGLSFNRSAYDNLRLYGSEPFRTLVKITMFYLEHGKVLEALESLMDLRDFDIQEEFLFERTMYKFVAGETYTITNTNRIKAIDDALNIFQAAGSTHQVNRLVDHIKLVVKANQFHNDDFDALIEKWGGTPSTKTPATTTVS